MRTVWLLLLLMAPLVRADESALSARDRAKRQLAVRAAAQKIVDTLQSGVDVSESEARRLSAVLGATMRADVHAHAAPEASLTLCRTLLDDERRQAINQWVDDAISRAREQTALPLERDDILRHVGSDWAERVAEDAKRFADKHLTTLFGLARQQSVALQRDELKDRITMPSEADLNARLTVLDESLGHHPPTPSDLDGLTAWLASLASPASQPLFEEVAHSTREAADQITQRVKLQYQQQLTALGKAATALPPTAIEADSIRAALMQATHTAIQAFRVEERRNRPASRTTIYGPLTLIAREATRQAGALQEERLVAAIQEQGDLPIEADAIESVLRSDLKAHRDPKQSRSLLITRYATELRPLLTTRLATLAARPDDSAFRSRLDALITGNKRISLAVDQQVAKTLTPLLASARRKVAQSQLALLFRQDPTTIEALTPDAVQAVWTTSRCEVVQHYSEAWESLVAAGLLPDPQASDILIEEARSETIATANRLIPVACRSMREQANHLATLEQEWTASLRKDVASGRSLEKITTDWTHELDRRWRTHAEMQKLPYPDLFALTLELLDKTVRKLFETRQAEMTEETAAVETPAEAAPEEEELIEEPPPPPEETPEESTNMAIEELLETLDFVLYFRDDRNGRSEALLLNGEGSPTRLLFDPGDVQAAVEAVYAAVIPAIERATRGKAKAAPERKGLLAFFQKPRSIEMKVAVLVGSEDVRHMMSILLRNRVELFVADWNANPSNTPLELEWEDNLEVAPGSGG
ncbi:MAG: hypothetical protein HQ523_08425 [Lentisphaerae bacterium]|nr:hypothetical protein [Lentisphaerota bacterium]